MQHVFSQLTEQLENYRIQSLKDKAKKTLSKKEGAKLDQLRYSDIMSYVQSCQRQMEQRIRQSSEANPIKKHQEETIKTILKQEKLERLYNEYCSSKKQGAEHVRNKVILGLLIWQGIDTGTLKALKLVDIDLENGTIYLSGTTRGNSQNMTLHSKQILPLHGYLLKWRDQLDLSGDELIPRRISNILNWLKPTLQKQNPTLLNIRQIRASAITHWLNNYNIRQVQYMAGHRYISSTEEYKQIDLESMKNALKKFHSFS